MKTCIVSFADGGQNGEYQRKLKRLEDSLNGNFDGDFLGFTDYNQIGCEPHSVIPYKFKPYAIQKAIHLGYELVLWCDSPIVAIRSLSKYIDHVHNIGHAFFRNIGHPIGKWANKKTIDYFFLDKQEAMEMEQIMACCMGFDFSRKFIRDIFKEYIGLSDNLFSGSWEDHRHDQVVMSCILREQNISLLTGHETFFMYEAFKNVPEFKIADSVCLVSK